MLSILILYALSASSFTISKAVLVYSKPIFFIGIRMVIAGTLLLSYYLIKKETWNISRKYWLRFALIVLLHIYLAFVLDLVALDYMTSFKGAFIYNLSPFVTALCSYFYFDEHMTWKKWLGLGIGFTGFLPMLIAHVPDEKVVGGIGFISWPEIMMVGSVISAVIGWIIVRSLVKDGYSPFFINGTGMLCGGILALITSPIFETWDATLVTDWRSFFYLLFLIIFFVNIIFYNFYGYLLKSYTATFLSFAGFISPLFAALFGWFFLGESIKWYFFLSVFVVVVGLTLFYQEELKQGYIVE